MLRNILLNSILIFQYYDWIKTIEIRYFFGSISISNGDIVLRRYIDIRYFFINIDIIFFFIFTLKKNYSSKQGIFILKTDEMLFTLT